MKYSHLLGAVRCGKWFILPQYAAAQKNIVEKLLDRQYTSEEFNAVLSDKKKVQAVILSATSNSTSDSCSLDTASENSIAIFEISGTMLKYGTMCSYGTTQIADAMREACDTGKLSGIILDMDSGGGSVDAIAPLIDSIKYAQSLGIVVVACVDLCASACYYVACFCDEIIAGNSISAEIGSIGVMMSFQDYTRYYAANLIDTHVVYSSFSDWKNLPYMNAINGAPDDETKYDLLKTEELDPLAKGFMDTVKTCRPNLNLDIEGIISGRMFFAQQAKEYGLIDGVGDMSMAIQRCKDLNNKNIINKYLNQ